MNISFCYEINNSDECLSIYFDTLDENLLVIIKNDDIYILDKDKTLNNLDKLINELKLVDVINKVKFDNILTLQDDIINQIQKYELSDDNINIIILYKTIEYCKLNKVLIDLSF
jgi:hypothetical protein